ncbi:hypothetical protein ABT168_21190 [Streptomyces sp. NPDC001793]
MTRTAPTAPDPHPAAGTETDADTGTDACFWPADADERAVGAGRG